MNRKKTEFNGVVCCCYYYYNYDLCIDTVEEDTYRKTNYVLTEYEEKSNLHTMSFHPNFPDCMMLYDFK
jgi:hypothetical protein